MIDTLNKRTKKNILRRLYWLFHESEGVRSLLIAAGDGEDDGYDVFWRTRLSSNIHTKSVQVWFGQSENLASDFSDEAKLWMKEASSSRRELLRPLAAAAAAQWLTKPGYDSQLNRYKSEFQVWVIHGYLGTVRSPCANCKSKLTRKPFTKNEDGALGDEFSNWAWYKCTFDDIPPQKLQHLAEWAQLAKTTHWYAGLGWIMMEGHYYEQAIANFKDVLHLDSDAWIANEGLARCLGEQGAYVEAIEWLEKVIECLPSSLHTVAGYLYPHIATCKCAIGDDEGAFEAAQCAYKSDWAIPLAQLRYLEVLDATRSFDAIIKVLKELDDCLASQKHYSYLVRFLALGNDAYDEIGKACRARGKPEFILAAMDKALTLIDQSDNEDMKSWLPAQLAAFRYD
jgi:tetratricopeptide (TPR) repeat protein